MGNELVIFIGRDMKQDERNLLKGKKVLKQPKNALYLDSFEHLNRLLSPKRIDLLKYLASVGVKGSSGKNVSEIASALNRRQEAISRDLHYLKGLDLVSLKKESQAVYVFTEFNSIKIET